MPEESKPEIILTPGLVTQKVRTSEGVVMPLPPEEDWGDFNIKQKPKKTLSNWLAKQDTPEEEIDWVVKGMLAPGDITILASEGGLGKSWKAAHIAMQVANGEFVDDVFPTRQGNVLWYDNENGTDENNRRCRLLDRYKGPLPGARFRKADVFFREQHWSVTEEGIQELRADIAEVKPALLIIDSLISVFPPGANENDAAEVRDTLDQVTTAIRIDDNGQRRLTPPACLLLHHTKKASTSNGYQSQDEWPTYRGSTDIKNAATFLIVMRGKTFEAKDGTEQQRVQFRFDKARRGRMDTNVYEFSLEDRGAPEGQPGHWIEYVSYGKATSFTERAEEKVLEAFTPLTPELSTKDIQESWNGFPENRGSMSRLITKLLEAGKIEKVPGTGFGTKQAMFCRKKASDAGENGLD